MTPSIYLEDRRQSPECCLHVLYVYVCWAVSRDGHYLILTPTPLRRMQLQVARGGVHTTYCWTCAGLVSCLSQYSAVEMMICQFWVRPSRGLAATLWRKDSCNIQHPKNWGALCWEEAQVNQMGRCYICGKQQWNLNESPHLVLRNMAPVKALCELPASGTRYDEAESHAWSKLWTQRVIRI